MSLASDIRELKRWRRSLRTGGRVEYRSRFARSVYHHQPEALVRFLADPLDASLWRDLLIDREFPRLFGLDTLPPLPPVCSWEEWRRYVHAFRWDLTGANRWMDRPAFGCSDLARLLDVDGDPASVEEFTRLEVLPDHTWPTNWFDAWRLALANGDGVYACVRGDDCRVLRVTGATIEQRRQMEESEDVRPEVERIRQNLNDGEAIWNEYRQTCL
jgi:hypothetical protein